MAYEAGNLVRISARFLDLNNTMFDPAAVIFRIVGPSSNVTYQYGVNAAVVRDAAGAYHVDVDTTAGAGPWIYRVYATGNGQASRSGSFSVTADNPI